MDVKMKPILFNTEMVRAILDGRKTVTRRVKKSEKVPYNSGDILYVRETFSVYNGHYIYKVYDRNKKILEDVGNVQISWHPSIHMPKEAARIFLRVKNVSAERLQEITEDGAKAEGMPDGCDYPVDKIYCPICKGKGLVGTHHPGTLGFMETECANCETFVKRFKNVWDSTVKKSDLDKYGWESNPWVWKIEFERADFDGSA